MEILIVPKQGLIYDEAPLKSWSFSTLNGLKDCQLRVALEKVEKLRPAKNAAMMYGGDVHIIGENYIKNEGRGGCPPEFKAHEEYLDMLIGNPTTVVEEQWMFDRYWNHLDAPSVEWFEDNHPKGKWGAPWFCGSFEGSYVALRGAADAYRFELDPKLGIYNKMVITDWKTGKYREGYSEQVELYALMAFLVYNDMLEYVETELAYVGHVTPKGATKQRLNTKFVGKEDGDFRGKASEGYHFSRKKDFKRLLRKWSKRAEFVLELTSFIPNDKNPFCGWCPHAKSQGGSCPLPNK